jgi:hypothetical protein
MGVDGVSEAAGTAIECEGEGFGKHETIPVSQEDHRDTSKKY